jgi:hypothetical protein
MGGFGSGDWADVMTRKVNTGRCRTLSVKTLKKMGVFDDDLSDEVFCSRRNLLISPSEPLLHFLYPGS